MPDAAPPGSPSRAPAQRTAAALVVREPGAEPGVETMLVDAPGPREVRVRILASGICHTDLHVARGRSWWPDYPYVLGHEGAGRIESVGSDVDARRIGELVLLAWKAPCGHCRFCTSGRTWLCADPPRADARLRLADGVQAAPSLRVGSHAELAVVPDTAAISLPPDMPPELACLLGCAVLTGVGAVRNTARVEPGQSVVVFGCGGVGLSIIMGARLAGAAQIIAVEPRPGRRRIAARVGADAVLDASEGIVERVRDASAGLGVDHAFDAVGRGSIIVDALGCLDSGGICTLVGTPDVDDVAAVPLELAYLKRLGLRVSQYGDVVPARDATALAAAHVRGDLELAALLSQELPLDAATSGLAALMDGDVVRTVLRPA